MRQIVSGQIQYPYQRGGETDNFLDRQGHRVRGEKNQTDGFLDITGLRGNRWLSGQKGYLAIRERNRLFVFLQRSGSRFKEERRHMVF
jgi:hypothetical protein